MKKLIVAGLALMTSGYACATGSAGCGLGSLIFKEDSIMSQTFAETTNNSTLTQFFGITSGTSNCSSHGFAFQQQEATVYAEANMPSLKIDMARGQGENLAAFSQVMGCSDVASFSKMAKGKYENIFPSRNVGAEQMIQNLRSEIKKDSVLKNNCTSAS